MISLIVQFLIAFPKIGAMVIKIRSEYVKELSNRRHRNHSDRIDEWLRGPKGKSDS